MRARVCTLSGLLTIASLAVLIAQDGRTTYRSWPAYGGGPDLRRYSALDHVNRQNVSRLRVAWTYDSGDASPGSQIESTPIVIDGVLYLQTPRLAVAAVDAATGHQLWRWTPPMGGGRSRGMNYWSDGGGRGTPSKATYVAFALE